MVRNSDTNWMINQRKIYAHEDLQKERYQEANDIEPEREEDKAWKRKYMELISSDKGCCLAKNGRLSEVFGTVHRN